MKLVKDRKTKERAIQEAKRVVDKCRKRGVLLMLSCTGKGNVVKIKPPLNIERDLAGKIVDILDESLHAIKKDM